MQIISPNKPEAEKAVLGAMILDPSVLKKSPLREENFYSPVNKRIFRALAKLDQEGIPIDPVSLLSKLSQEEATLATDYSHYAVTSANVPYYETILLDLTHKRNLQRVCLDVLQSMESLTLDDLIAKLREEM